MNEQYNPKTIDISCFTLPIDLENLVDKLAENVHAVWARQRMDEGWTWGEERNDNLKHHPYLVPYDELPNSEKEYDRQMAMQTLRAIQSWGFEINKMSKDCEALIEPLANKIHDTWCDLKKEHGWKLDAKLDAEKKTHPDLKDYNKLNNDTKEYNIRVARLLVTKAKDAGLSIEKTFSNIKHPRQATKGKNEIEENSIIGKSLSIERLIEQIAQCASCDSTVLITGETGTGKELVAMAIHHNSSREGSSFIIIHCGGIAETLLESELFGYKKGAFTGATQDKIGYLGAANGGTLFLDEVGDLSPSLQVTLLRVLHGNTYIPVGGTEEIKVDVRIICATHRDLPKKVMEGTFREDLYYRLYVLSIITPPLRERKEDLPLLTKYFLDKLNNKNKKNKHITPLAHAKLIQHSWPGNIRELENALERAFISSGSEEEICEKYLTFEIDQKRPATESFLNENNLHDDLPHVGKVLRQNKNKNGKFNKSAAARKLNISNTTLNNLLQKAIKELTFDKTAEIMQLTIDELSQTTSGLENISKSR